MPSFIAKNDPFVCEHCGKHVEKIVYGGSYRNHCPFCLYSKHVDGDTPGDRLNACKGLMAPIGVTTKSGGEFSIIHECEKCGFRRLNRIAGDDDTDLLTKIAGFVVK
ncbi:RNHCP domain-containing protein [Candidatus Microgenomates bacterium]|nr:RNHCP domain-containing protein [Candidatus Microgenomates bacterium]